MKVKYKGILKRNEPLPSWPLPVDAIRVKEPDNYQMITLVSLLFIIPALVLVAIVALMSYKLHGEHTVSGFSWVGLALSFAVMIPHEFLHAICFGKGAEVEMYFLPQSGNVALTSARAISKRRFIILSLLPGLILGWIPLLIWAILPYPGVSDALFTFSIICAAVHGAGDNVGVYNIIRQVPKGSMMQMSGNNPHWFKGEPDEIL